jgi:hypothetical protein
MATKKVIAFSIEIEGKKDIKDVADLFGLLEKQIKAVNKQLEELNKNTKELSGKGLKQAETQLNKTGNSAKRLTSFFKTSFDQFEEGNKIVRDLGNGYFEVEKRISETSKEIKENAQSIGDLVKRNKELKKALEEADTAAEKIDFQGQTVEVSKLTKEYSENRNAILAFRKELRTGTKEADVQQNSIADLRKRVSDLKKQYIQLTPAQRNALIGPGAKIRRELIKTTKELKRQEEKIGDFRRSVGNYEKSLKRVGTAALKVFGIRGAFEGLRRVGQGLAELVRNGAETNETFANIQKAAAGFSNVLTNAGTGILNTFGGTIQKVIDNFSFVIFKVSEGFQSVANSGGIIGRIFSGIGQVLQDFPAIWGGAANVISNFVEIVSGKFINFQLQAQSTFLAIKKSLFSLTGADTAEIEARLNVINKQLQDNAKNALSFGRAYAEGFEAVKKEQEEFIKRNEEETKQREAAEAAREAAQEARKKAQEEEAERLKQLQADREALRQQLIDEENARLAIIKDLSKQVIDLEIQNEEDRTKAAINAENQRFAELKATRNANFQSLLDDIVRQEAQIRALFGDNSQQLADFEEKTANDLRVIQGKNNEIAEQQEKEHQSNLQAIRDNAAAEELKAKKEFFEIEIEEEDKEAAEREEREAEESDNRIQKQIENAKATKAAVLSAVQGVFDGVAQIASIAAEAEQAQFEKAIQDRQDNIDALNEDLQDATGLQKKFLEQQIENEKKAQEEINKQAEKARKEAAEGQKAVAIIQAIINTALAVTQALGSSPPPASFILAAAAGAAGAVQIASIAAQKFALGGIAQTGGVLNGPSHEAGGIPFAVGGRVGFEAEGGEAIINKKSTSMFKPLLSRINEAGGGVSFQTGGFLGAPVAPPTLATANNQAQQNLDSVLIAFNQQTTAINSRIDRIQVVNSVDDFNSVASQDATLDAETTL